MQWPKLHLQRSLGAKRALGSRLSLSKQWQRLSYRTSSLGHKAKKYKRPDRSYQNGLSWGEWEAAQSNGSNGSGQLSASRPQADQVPATESSVTAQPTSAHPSNASQAIISGTNLPEPPLGSRLLGPRSAPFSTSLGKRAHTAQKAPNYDQTGAGVRPSALQKSHPTQQNLLPSNHQTSIGRSQPKVFSVSPELRATALGHAALRSPLGHSTNVQLSQHQQQPLVSQATINRSTRQKIQHQLGEVAEPLLQSLQVQPQPQNVSTSSQSQQVDQQANQQADQQSDQQANKPNTQISSPPSPAAISKTIESNSQTTAEHTTAPALTDHSFTAFGQPTIEVSPDHNLTPITSAFSPSTDSTTVESLRPLPTAHQPTVHQPAPHQQIVNSSNLSEDTLEEHPDTPHQLPPAIQQALPNPASQLTPSLPVESKSSPVSSSHPASSPTTISEVIEPNTQPAATPKTPPTPAEYLSTSSIQPTSEASPVDSSDSSTSTTGSSGSLTDSTMAESLMPESTTHQQVIHQQAQVIHQQAIDSTHPSETVIEEQPDITLQSSLDIQQALADPTSKFSQPVSSGSKVPPACSNNSNKIGESLAEKSTEPAVSSASEHAPIDVKTTSRRSSSFNQLAVKSFQVVKSLLKNGLTEQESQKETTPSTKQASQKETTPSTKQKSAADSACFSEPKQTNQAEPSSDPSLTDIEHPPQLSGSAIAPSSAVSDKQNLAAASQTNSHRTTTSTRDQEANDQNQSEGSQTHILQGKPQHQPSPSEKAAAQQSLHSEAHNLEGSSVLVPFSSNAEGSAFEQAPSEPLISNEYTSVAQPIVQAATPLTNESTAPHLPARSAQHTSQQALSLPTNALSTTTSFSEENSNNLEIPTLQRRSPLGLSKRLTAQTPLATNFPDSKSFTQAFTQSEAQPPLPISDPSQHPSQSFVAEAVTSRTAPSEPFAAPFALIEQPTPDESLSSSPPADNTSADNESGFTSQPWETQFDLRRIASANTHKDSHQEASFSTQQPQPQHLQSKQLQSKQLQSKQLQSKQLQSKGPQLEPWHNQFRFDNHPPTSTGPSAHNSDEPLLKSDTDSASQADTYESEGRHSDDIDPGVSLGTAAENAGRFEIKPEEKIDNETLETLARNFYGLLRMRLEEQQYAQLNQISGLSPWADIITFPIIGNSKSLAPKILQTESSAPTLMLDRKINQLSEELYQHVLSRMLSERTRSGWRYPQ